MSSAITEFFDQLHRRGHERLLRKTTGTIRFEIAHDHEIAHWLISIINGAVQVSGGNVRASPEKREVDCVIRTDSAFFERMARGEAKPISAWLRNDITSEGKARFVLLLERLFPGPPGARHPRTLAHDHGRPR